MSGPAPLLEIRDLRIGFEAKKDVVDGIGLEVPRRSFSCLVGESGSGKTLTGLSVLGLCRGARVSGKILWQEATRSVDLLSLPEESMRKYRGKKIAFIFQDPASSLNPVKKIGVQLGEVFRLEGPRPDKEIQRETLKLLARVHFPDPQRIYSSFPHELSGGMRQRVLIALAIARGPELLIADEPTTALDAPLEKEILLLVRELQLLMGLTILWITHDMSIAVTMADRMTVMRHGYIVETLLRTQGGFEPQDAYSQALLTASLWRGAPKSPIEVARV